MLAIDAGIRQAKPVDRAAVKKVLLDDFLGIARVHKAIPDGFRVNDHDCGVLALVQAAGLVHADATLQTCGFNRILERGAEFVGILVAAGASRGGFVALVQANEQVVGVAGHL